MSCCVWDSQRKGETRNNAVIRGNSKEKDRVEAIDIVVSTILYYLGEEAQLRFTFYR